MHMRPKLPADEKRTPITIKLPPGMIERIDEFRETLSYPTTRTAVIETAIDYLLTRHEKQKVTGAPRPLPPDPKPVTR